MELYRMFQLIVFVRQLVFILTLIVSKKKRNGRPDTVSNKLTNIQQLKIFSYKHFSLIKLFHFVSIFGS